MAAGDDVTDVGALDWRQLARSVPRQALVRLPSTSFYPVVQQLAIRSHCPYRSAREREWALIRRSAEEAFVAPMHAKARGNAAAVLVLEALDDVELESADRTLKSNNPSLEGCTRDNIDAARRDDEVFRHEVIDRFRVLRRLPDFGPEGFIVVRFGSPWSRRHEPNPERNLRHPERLLKLSSDDGEGRGFLVGRCHVQGNGAADRTDCIEASQVVAIEA